MAKNLIDRVLTRVAANLLTKEVTANLNGKLTKPQIKKRLREALKKSDTDLRAEVEKLLGEL